MRTKDNHAGGGRIPTKGVGIVLLHLRNDFGVLAIKFIKAAYAPLLSHHLIYFGRITDANHACSCTDERLSVQLRSGLTLCADELGILGVLRGVQETPKIPLSRR